MSDKHKVLRAAGLIGVLTLFSRCTGLIRDAAIAAILGPSRYSDVFWTAFELPNLVRRVIGEGALSSFIVPLMSERIHKRGTTEGWRFLNLAGNLMLVLSLAFALAGMYFSREVFLIFGGLGLLATDAAAYVDLGARLTRLMFPFVIGLAAASVLMGACHTLRVFGPPALGSVMLNLAMIAAAGAALIFKPAAERTAAWLGWAVLLGALLRVVIMIPTLRRAGWRWRPGLSLRDPDLRRLLMLMAPGLLAVGISQINLAVAGFFAMYLGEGIKTSIGMAGRLIQFPLGLTATAAATAMLPQLAQFFIHQRHDELREMMALNKRIEIVVMVPAMLGLMVLGLPIVELIFQHGQWTAEASRWTWLALLAYAPGLLPLGWIRLIEPVFFARHDRVTPLKAAALSILVNVALNWLLAFHSPLPRLGLAPAGLAIANTAAAFVNYFVLSRWLGGVLERPLGERPRIGETLWKSLLAAAVACAAGGAFYWGLVNWTGVPSSTLTRAAILLPAIGLVAGLHFALVRMLRVPDSERVTAAILKKLRKPPPEVIE